MERSKEQEKQQEATPVPQPGASIENIKEPSSVEAGPSVGAGLHTPIGTAANDSTNVDYTVDTVEVSITLSHYRTLSKSFH